jgi:alpha-amylase/alpha-mannosidase (GH57 family)
MHQPYYKNILTKETPVPWVRLHGVKDYLDMVLMLEKFPKIHQTFNLVPSLLEQIEDYTTREVKDKFLELSYIPAAKLTSQDKEFILDRFFSINPARCIAVHPRYYELYLKKAAKKEFTTQDYLDLQVWFNLAWIDPYFRETIADLKIIAGKGRFFNEEEKHIVLESHIEILEDIIPVYKKCIEKKQVEVILSPYYHPILPLLYTTNTAKEANPKTVLPHTQFNHPEDAKAQINDGIRLFKEKFGAAPRGMWPSEESVSQHIVPFIIEGGIHWIVADEGILFKSLKMKKRNSRLLYQPHLLKRKEGNLSIVFRDRNLSDLIGFVYHKWEAALAVNDFMKHLENIAASFKGQDILVTIAMDGENAWEYYANDGHDFLELLYQRMSEADFMKTTTVAEYLKEHPAAHEIKYLAAGSWIYGEFAKWIGSPLKNKAWEYLAKARRDLENALPVLSAEALKLAWKQIYILEGSDWFWWYGDDDPGDFDKLFRMHLSNFYKIIGKEIPDYVHRSL